MVVDHVNEFWLARAVPEMTLLGRAVIPLFCYALAVALIRVKPEELFEYGAKKYAPRLLLVAVIAEPVIRFSRGDENLSILFTLALGAAFAGILLRLRDGYVYLLMTLAALTAAFESPVEAGLPGVMLPAAIIMVMRGKKPAVFFMLLLLGTLNAINLTGLGDHSFWQVAEVAGTLFLACTITPAIFLQVAKEFPRNGRWLHKYFLHIFYPAHIAVLAISGYFFFGYKLFGNG